VIRRHALAVASLTLVLLLARAAPGPILWLGTAPRSSITVGAMGSGPTIMLVHGLGSDAKHWLPVARNLARDHRVVFVELPGHGLAPMTTPFTLEQATLSLERAIEQESPEPIVLVGHSVGGLVATSAALRLPKRVRSLVLVESALAPQMTRGESDTLLAMLDRDWAGTLHSVYASFGRDSAQGEVLWAEASQVDRASMRAWIAVTLSADLTAEAAGLEMPVLAVLSPRSWEPIETWAHASEALGLARIPHLKAVRIHDCGHFVMLDQPRALADAIRRFAARADTTFALR